MEDSAQQARREKNNAYHREYNKKNRDKRRIIEARWKAKNPDKVKAYNKTGVANWYKKNKGKTLANVSGLHVETNLQILTRYENRKKKNCVY